MTLDDGMHGIRLPVMRRAEELGSVTADCRELGTAHTRTQPRHAWTNGFAERLQDTILEEQWRLQFRHRYFTSRAALARSPEELMRFYNEQRPHLGYRLRGHPPAALFWDAAAR